jgi:ABC-type phosphate transport system substrate-binding protein
MRMKNILYILAALALGLSVSVLPAQAGRQQVILSGTLVIEGTGDSRDLLRAIARRFEQIHPNVFVEVPGDTGTHSGIRKVGESKIEMARVARPPKNNEKRYGLTYRAFAESPVVFAIPPNVRRIGDLSTEQGGQRVLKGGPR